MIAELTTAKILKFTSWIHSYTILRGVWINPRSNTVEQWHRIGVGHHKDHG